jgi:rifampicin phosphotransferase
MPAYVLALGDHASQDGVLVGGKARGLHALLERGFPVPPGFAITTSAYRDFIALNDLASALDVLAAAAGTPQANRRVSAEVQARFAQAELTPGLEVQIRRAYDELGGGPVAVRSSAVAEDTPDASFAGQQESYLWVSGADAVVRNVVKCWASLYTPQAIEYRLRQRVAPEAVTMCVIVQRMVPARAAGVILTLEPITGDRDLIYIESAHGLGEGVVRGDVGSDRFWIRKRDLRVVREERAEHTHAYLVDEAFGGVRRVQLDAERRHAPSLSRETARSLAALAERIESACEVPMDIEWAVDHDETVFVLQARPETVWSRRVAAAAPGTRGDVLHHPSRPESWWTTTNVGEAVPGVPTPLSWSFWGLGGEHAIRRCFRTIGALTKSEAEVPAAAEDRLVSIFYGHAAFHLNLLCDWGDRIPTTSGRAVAQQLCGFVPPDHASRRAWHHYPRTLLRMSIPPAVAQRLARQTRDEMEAYWAPAVARAAVADQREALALLLGAFERFLTVAYRQCIVVFGAVQPAYDLLERISRQAGLNSQPLMTGLGNHEESALVADIWKCSRERLGMQAVLARYGYHGPSEGEMSSVRWREDAAPLVRLIERYGELDDGVDPALADAERACQRRRHEAELLALTPPYRRAAVRLALRYAARSIPLRGAIKVALVQTTDAARAAARRLGHHLTETGVLEQPDDVFYLTIDELRSDAPSDAIALVNARRAHRARYLQLELPTHWQGMAEPIAPDLDPRADTIAGIAASPGTIEARVRVLTDPTDASVQNGEILVARDTDQGWASLMFISGGLIADIGGVMSHTAVVARELSIPCVVGTRRGTKVLRTGDLVRLDGGSGEVVILERAERTPVGPHA